jgi:hypothetical protein
MSITKLKTVGRWHPPPQRRGDPPAEGKGKGSIRGRIITGLLTGDDPEPDERAVRPDPRTQ